MPLVKGEAASTRKGFSENVRREMHEGKPQKQAVAIAYSEADRGKMHKKKAHMKEKMHEKKEEHKKEHSHHDHLKEAMKHLKHAHKMMGHKK